MLNFRKIRVKELNLLHLQYSCPDLRVNRDIAPIEAPPAKDSRQWQAQHQPLGPHPGGWRPAEVKHSPCSRPSIVESSSVSISVTAFVLDMKRKRRSEKSTGTTIEYDDREAWDDIALPHVPEMASISPQSTIEDTLNVFLATVASTPSKHTNTVAPTKAHVVSIVLLEARYGKAQKISRMREKYRQTQRATGV